MAEPRTVTIEKRGYSSQPWRLIDSRTGNEVCVDRETFEHPDLGQTQLPRHGYDTKAEAIAALGRAAGTALDIIEQGAGRG